MKREVLKLESSRFTSLTALTREIEALLADSSYCLEVHVRATELEQLSNEMESWRTLGRLKVVTA